MFHIGLPYLCIEDDGQGGVCVVGRGLARVLLGRVTIAGTEIRRACGATSQSRWSSLHYLALETTMGETYVLELSPVNLDEVLGYLTVAGAHVDPEPCTWSYRPGGVTLSPRPAQPE
jgi:hypothetical protein